MIYGKCATYIGYRGRFGKLSAAQSSILVREICVVT